MNSDKNKEVIKTEAQEPKKKRVSKTWEAILKYQGTIIVYDPSFLV